MPVDGPVCSDGNVCTVGDHCTAGICLAGIAVVCDDANVCTSDLCDSGSGKCTAVPLTGGACSDDDACTAGDVCTNGKCAGNSLNCADANVCTADSCDLKIGCVHTSVGDGALCDDGNACSSADACVKGVCAGVIKSCDDGLACTLDICDVKTAACTHAAIANCVCAKDLDCDDGQACTFDVCNAAKACVHAAKPEKSQCNDGSLCTGSDICTAGVCVGTPLVVCNDGKVCTDDACDPKSGGCVYANNSSKCDDGSACTNLDVCAVGACKGVAVKDGLGCDDGSVCTIFDGCVAGVCVGTPIDVAATCDDGNACTLDTCEAVKGCINATKLFKAEYNKLGLNAAYSAVAVGDGFALVGETGAKDSKSDAWLLRTDSVGNLLWDKTYGGDGADSATAVVAVSDGLVFVGQTNSKGAGLDEFWLVRTDNKGEIVWDKTYGGQVQEYATALVSLPDGFAAAGYVFVPKDAGQPNLRLIRTNLKGELLWDKSYGGAGQDIGHALAVADGGFASAGGTNSKGAGGGDFWLVRTDATGMLLWDKTYGTKYKEEANAVVVLSDGFALAGRTAKPINGKGGYNFWLVRTDSAGTVLWDNAYDASEYDMAQGLVATADGFALFGNSINDDGSNKMNSWLVRTDALGNVLWTNAYSGAAQGVGFGLVALPDGFGLVGVATEQPAGNGYGWLIRTDAFGHASCAESGTCFNKIPADCDDAKPCTADVCDGKLGCQHSNLADGSACGGGKSCKVGTCL